MEKEHRILSNENMLRSILQFSNIKDQASVAQVNQIFYKSSKHFSYYWREETKQIFTSNQTLYIISKSSSYFTEPSVKNHLETSSNLDWKNFLKEGILIRNYWDNYRGANRKLKEELSLAKIEIYSVLKEYYHTSELRKNFIYVESEINSNFQTFLYDYYDYEKHLYLFYNQNMKNSQFTLIHNPGCLFSFILESFSFYYNEININEKFKDVIKRFINYEILDKIENAEENDLLYTLNAIIQTVNFYCRFYSYYLQRYLNNHQQFLIEYLKYYNHYAECIIYLEKYLENLKIALNYIYQKTFKSGEEFPRFTFYCLMMKIWDKEVFKVFSDLFFSSTKKILNLYFSNELKEFENNSIKYSKIIIDEIPRENLDSTNFNIDLEFLCSRRKNGNSHIPSLSPTTSTSTNFCHNDLNFYSKIDSLNKNEKFNIEFIIEDLSKHLLDFSVNERKVFFINSSDFYGDKYYQGFEEDLLSIVDDFCVKAKSKMNSLIEYFKDQNNLINMKLIPRTRFKIVKLICENLMKISLGEILIMYQNFLNSKEIIRFKDEGFHSMNTNMEVELDYNKELFNKLFDITCIKFKNKFVSRFITLLFLNRRIKEEDVHLFTYRESFNWLEQVKIEMDNQNALIFKVNSRRNLNQSLSLDLILRMRVDK